MPTFQERATAFLHARFPTAPILHRTLQLLDTDTVIKPVRICIAYDSASALKQALIAVPDLGSHGELEVLTQTFPREIAALTDAVWIQGGNALHGHFVSSDQMLFSPKLLVFTDTLHCANSDVLNAFERAGHLIDLVRESEMLSSVFISYGGPDEAVARYINDYLVSHSVKTWFFPENALPGQKLHRVMSSGITQHDRVILICSAASLTRPGVLNEIERVLEREAKEGGTDILIPISLDRFVFDQWKPVRADVAEQVRSRVIATFPSSHDDKNAFVTAADKLLKALRK